MKYWLMKSEPSEFSIDKLKQVKTEMWDGVRNYQVRNMIRDDIKVGDLALFYHSNAGDETGVVGVMEISRKAYPDPTQFDMNSAHRDPKSKLNNPRWFCVDVKFIDKFDRVVTLKELKSDPELSDFRLVRKGNRLSIMPVTKVEFDYIKKLANRI